MTLEPADQFEDAVDRFGKKYRVSLLITLTILAALAVWSRSAAIAFVIFILFFWVLAAMIRLVHPLVQAILPKRLLPETKREIQASVSITVFLGSCAMSGIVLRGENAVSEFVINTVPGGPRASFIDPTFSLVFIIGIWLYTAFRLRKRSILERQLRPHRDHTLAKLGV